MQPTSPSLDQVQEALSLFQEAYSNHQEKKYKEAVEAFRKISLINASDDSKVQQLEKRLKTGGFKLAQESLGWMGSAVIHIKELLELMNDEDRQNLDIDKNLKEAFDSWDS